MSISTLEATISKIRAEFDEKHSTFKWMAADVANDTRLTPDAKKRDLAALYVRIKADADAFREKEQAAVAAERQSIERSIFGSFSTDPSAMIAYRDAQDRAQRIKSESEATEMLRTATLSGDQTLAAAVLGRALAQGFQPTVDRYLAEYPSKATALTDLTNLTRFASRMANDFDGWFGVYFIGTPQLLSGMSDVQLRHLAEGDGKPAVTFGNGMAGW